MFEPDPIVREAAEALYARVAAMQIRETISHAAIEAIVGVERRTKHWGTCIAKVRRRLLRETTFWLASDRATGYVIAGRKEQSAVPVVESARASRRLRKGAKVALAIPVSEMSDHECRLRNARADMARNHASTLDRERRRIEREAEAEERRQELNRRRRIKLLAVHQQDKDGRATA